MKESSLLQENIKLNFIKFYKLNFPKLAGTKVSKASGTQRDSFVSAKNRDQFAKTGPIDLRMERGFRYNQWR